MQERERERLTLLENAILSLRFSGGFGFAFLWLRRAFAATSGFHYNFSAVRERERERKLGFSNFDLRNHEMRSFFFLDKYIYITAEIQRKRKIAEQSRTL